jgi:hypothetical protein
MRLLERYESVSGKRLPRDARGGWSVKHLTATPLNEQ